MEMTPNSICEVPGCVVVHAIVAEELVRPLVVGAPARLSGTRVGVAVLVGVRVLVAVTRGVGVRVRVAVGVGVRVGVRLAVAVGVAVRLAIALGWPVAVALAVAAATGARWGCWTKCRWGRRTQPRRCPRSDQPRPD